MSEGLFLVAFEESCCNLFFQFGRKFGIVLDDFLHGITSLSEPGFAIAEPGSALADDTQLYAKVNDFAAVRYALAKSDFKFSLAEGRRHLVLDYANTHLIAYRRIAVLERRDATDVKAYGRIELECIAAGSRLGIAEHDADFLAQLVDEDAGGVRLADIRRELAERLAHETCLKTDAVVTHIAFDFSLRREGGHRVNDYDIYSRGTDELVGYFECLLAIIRLGYEELINLYTQLGRIEAVKGMFGVNEGGSTAVLLRFG